MKIAVYPGSFDPITNGHIDIIKRSLLVFDKLIVAVNDNPHPLKPYLFNIKERLEMVKEALSSYQEVEIESFKGLLVDYIKKKRARFVIRGLRALSDFEYEFQMYLMNKRLNPDLEMIYFMTNQKYSHLSSSIIKEIARLGGKTKNFVPPFVEQMLHKKFANLTPI
ncbi:pantetheine-phosphate adenylyltransferase [Candidatus Aerophobetes bacterium]|nr:pantetheine-phosphate adenylyltransferase [Candidatus Aerophobetes bacterium]